MVTEIACFTARPGKENALRDGLTQAMAVFRRAPACHGITLRQCVEEPNVFLYQIEWESLELHQTFRASSPPPLRDACLTRGFSADFAQLSRYTSTSKRAPSPDRPCRRRSSHHTRIQPAVALLGALLCLDNANAFCYCHRYMCICTCLVEDTG
jgi:hypothetical protein